MKNLNLLIALTLIVLTCAVVSCTQDDPPDTTTEFVLPDNALELEDAWARPGRQNGVTAVYLHVLNGLPEADTLLSLSSPSAGLVELHETYDRGEGMMGMRQAETPVFPALEITEMRPGGLHIMLMQLNRELTEGDEVEVVLNFATSGEKRVQAPVRSPG